MTVTTTQLRERRVAVVREQLIERTTPTTASPWSSTCSEPISGERVYFDSATILRQLGLPAEA